VQFAGAASGIVGMTAARTGAANSPFPITGTAAGRVENRGTAGGTMAFGGSLSGSVGVRALPLSGTATGSVRIRAAASGGVLPLSGTATGSVRIRAAASGGVLPLPGSATGSVRIRAAGSGSMGLTGAAAGQPVMIPNRFAFPGKPANGGTLVPSRRGGRVMQGGLRLNDFTIKRGDSSPAIRYALEPDTVDLTGATVRFQMRVRNGAQVLDAAAAIVTAAGMPTVQYGWQTGDTATAGLYEAEFRVLYSNGAVETFPNQGFILVRIAEDVRPA
jgi:hypothetical protein